MNSIPITGFVRVVLRDKAGAVIEIVESENLVVNSGNTLITTRLISNVAAIAYHFGFGQGSMPAISSNTGMENEFSGPSWTGYTRISVTPINAENILTFNATLTNSSGSSHTVQEIGIFNALSSGTMLARWITGGLTLANSDALEINWQLQVGT